MPKERSINPAAAQRKADKQKEIAKSKKNVQQQRNEKLARRNPERVQRQIDELKDVEARGGALRPKDKDTLAQLERDLKGIQRARGALGDAAPKFASREQRPHNARQEQLERRQNLGKRRRGADEEAAAASRNDGEHSSSDETDAEARDIPMPLDTPPPTPPHRRASGVPRSGGGAGFADPQIGPDGVRVPHALPAKPAPPPLAQTVYSSAPQLRDLKKEAARFVPAAVAQHKRRVKGDGRLLEPEEIGRLEQAGYYAAAKAADAAGREAALEHAAAQTRAAAKTADAADVDAEFRRFEQEVNAIYPPSAEAQHPRGVQMEEVEDAGD